MDCLTRRRFVAGISAGILVMGGCEKNTGRADLVWGGQGVTLGRFQTPRAIAIDREDRLYIVDKTGRIQVATVDGQPIRSWVTPEIRFGMPSGLTCDNHGHLMVADTHCSRVLFYTPEGELLADKTIGGVTGYGPGEFNLVTDIVQDTQGCYYAGEMGEHDRIQKFSPDGEFLYQWGTFGSDPGQMMRPQNMEIDAHDHIWVADAGNHRIQVFDATGHDVRLVRVWGTQGRDPGQLNYPYDLALDGHGHVYVCEFGNHRVQKFTIEGRPVASWGTHGRGDGELYQPWALALDSRGRVHVLDTKNHRVQRIWL